MVVQKNNLDSVNKEAVFVNFVDFNYECCIRKSDQINTSSILSQKNVPTSVAKFHLSLEYENQLSHLDVHQKEHLNQIFLQLIEYTELNKTPVKYGFSLELAAEPQISSTECLCQPIRLHDKTREDLSINDVIDMCIQLMSNPFRGFLTHLENDYSSFDCVNTVSTQFKYKEEMEKLFRATGLFNGELTCCEQLKVGQLCLIDETLSDMSPNKCLVPNSTSILVLNDEYTNDKPDSTHKTFKLMFRGLIIDESYEKCVVLNVDNGKKLTLKKRRIRPLQHTDLGSKRLLQLIPFMMIKARPKTPIEDANVKKRLKNSRYYGEEMNLNVLTSCSVRIRDSFCQTELDLMKVVDLDEPDEVALSTNCKRKRVEDEQVKEAATKETEPPVLSNDTSKQSKVSRQPSGTSLKKADFFIMSHVKSLSSFYLHSSEALKNIALIEEQIQMELLNNRAVNKQNKKDPKLLSIYGVFNEKENKYYRVRLMSRVLMSLKPSFKSVQTGVSNEDIFQAFYLDYGFTDQVRAKNLIHLSEFIQQTAPQAICCKLHGFQTNKTSFADADTDSENKENSCDDSHNDTGSTVGYDDDEESRLASSLFVKLLNNKPFMATAFKRFNMSKRIDNRLPLQADNLKPIEVVIHLFKPEEFEHNVSPNNNYVDEINDVKTDLKFRNASYLLKLLIEETKNKTQKRVNSVEKHFISSTPLSPIHRLNLAKLLNENRELVVSFGHIINPNQFYLNLEQSSLNKRLENDYASVGAFGSLSEKELKKGMYCAYVVRSQAVYKRGLLVDFARKQSKSNRLVATVYLIDAGKYVETGVENLCGLAGAYHAIEPQCFECTFGLKYLRENEDVIVNKFRHLVQTCTLFKIRLIEELKPSDESPHQKSRFLVDLYGRPDRDTATFSLHISEELKAFVRNSFQSNLANVSLKYFVQNELPLNQTIKIQLTNVDSIKHFGVVINADIERRSKFLNDFHQWHKENKKSLKPLQLQAGSDNCIGKPCAINSIQIGKWCRGVVANNDMSSQMSSIYLLDYCRTAQVKNERVYQLDNKSFLNEPIYAHRCQLLDSSQQRDKFEKYLDLLKSDINSTGLGVKSGKDESFNSSHISMENIEIQIVCLNKKRTELNQLTSLKNNQYTVNVVDFKRLRQTFPNSPFQNLVNQQSLGQNLLKPRQITLDTQQTTTTTTVVTRTTSVDSMVSLSLTNSSMGTTVYEKKNATFDETTENILSSNQPRTALSKDFNSVSSNDVFSYASSNIKNLNTEGNDDFNYYATFIFDYNTNILIKYQINCVKNV